MHKTHSRDTRRLLFQWRIEVDAGRASAKRWRFIGLQIVATVRRFRTRDAQNNGILRINFVVLEILPATCPSAGFFNADRIETPIIDNTLGPEIERSIVTATASCIEICIQNIIPAKRTRQSFHHYVCTNHF